MTEFGNPWALLLLLLIPMVIVLHLRFMKTATLRFSSLRGLSKGKHSWKQRWFRLPLVIRVVVLVLLVIAMAQPRNGQEKVRDISQGIAIEMVVDRSGSMQAEMDYQGRTMNRLETVKQVFEEFVTGQAGVLEGRPNDLIGLVSFARYADTLGPLTLAHGAIAQLLQNIKLVTQRNEDGTAIGDAIALAAARLKTAEETIARQQDAGDTSYHIKSKIIILLTDGQSNAGKYEPLEAAKMAKEWGIKIYAIGIGGNEGMLRQQGLLGSFLMQSGIGGVDKQTLQSLADTTGGLFRMAEDAEALISIYREIDQLERSDIESLRYLDYHEWFQPFALMALLLLIVEMSLTHTVFRKIP
ncbi:MAG: VWA domain-containing protein [SAR324 cluster bacterium]|nr:VWA domain-containing protein [SAR324 cluster bacterium]